MSTDRDSPLPSLVGDSYAARLGLALAFAIVVVVAFGAVISAQASATLAADSSATRRRCPTHRRHSWTAG